MAESGKSRGRPPYYFSLGQLIILSAIFTVTSALVFLLGALVGQRVEERKLLNIEEPAIKIPVPPLAKRTSQQKQSKGEMTFYDILSRPPSKTKSGAVAGGAKEATKVKPVRPRKKTDERSRVAKTIRRETSKPAPGRVWAVQVNAFANSDPAEIMVNKLKGKGYDAYLVSANVQGRTWYRVRVGRLATRQEARDLQKILQTKEKFTKAILVSR